ncbi:MAG TPA: P22 phage major capsid protein family protein [Blastocatellia bacterium]|nr:P22 phage major capsid protein family protein [Blastocatellia bacterium]
MANTLTEIMPKILARGLMHLRKRVVMPRLVNNSYSTEAAEKGDVINVPIPVSRTAKVVTPGPTPPVTSDSAPAKVQIALDQWYHEDFRLTDKELQLIDRQKDFMPMEMEGAIEALATNVNQYIFSKYKKVYGYVGTAGTTPFATDITAATALFKTLNKQRCGKELRRAVLDFDAEANALALAPFRDVSQSTDANLIIEGTIGRKLGFDWLSDDDVPTHTKVAAGTILVDQADVAVGNKTVHFDGVTTLPAAGDVFTVAGDSQTYVIISTSVLSTADADFTFEPAAQVAWADNAAVTFKATHVVNLGFHRDAFAFATRPLTSSTVDLQLGNQIMSMQDPKSGLVLRLEISRQHKQTVWDFDILYGAELIRPELAARLAG